MRLILGVNKPRKPILGVVLSGKIVEIGEKVTEFEVGDQVFGMTGTRFGGTTALHFLRKANINAGQQILIYGASSSVGTSAVQIAKYLGTHVTAVCNSKHTNVVQTLGADQMIDYKTDAFLKLNQQYDIIFDAVGKIKRRDVSHLLKPEGTFISVAGDGVASEKKEDLRLLAQMYDEGKLKPVIDRSFSLDEIAAAHQYVDEGRKTGNVSITISHD